MSLDSGIGTDMGRPCFELALHDTETFLDLPSLMIDFDDFSRIVIQIRIECIESIIRFFFRDPFHIHGKERIACNLSLIRNRSLFDQPSVIILVVRVSFRGSILDAFSGTFDLPIAYGKLVILIFQ